MLHRGVFTLSSPLTTVVAGPKGARKGNRRNKGVHSRVGAAPNPVAVVPKAPTHSLTDYSKFDNIVDSSEDDADDTVAPQLGCNCEKCRAAWSEEGPDDEAEDEHDESHDESHSVLAANSSNTSRAANPPKPSGFSFSKALGDAAKKKVAEAKVARNASLQASTHRFTAHTDQLGMTKSASPGKQSRAVPPKSALERLFAMQDKFISAYLERKGHGQKVPDVVHMLEHYRQTDEIDESPNEAILRIFVDIGIPIDITDAPSMPVALPASEQSPQSKVPRNGVSAHSAGMVGDVLKKHGFTDFQVGDFSDGKPCVLSSAGVMNGKAAVLPGESDSDCSSVPCEESDDDEMPQCKSSAAALVSLVLCKDFDITATETGCSSPEYMFDAKL